MTLVAIIQARMASTRLPGKVLKDICGRTMLELVIRRTQQSKSLNKVVVATTTSIDDNILISECERLNVTFFRGDELDVLDRYYRTALAYSADIIVRITSDCPLIEPIIIDRVVQEFMQRQPEVDYTCNMLPRRTFPRGLDTEVIRFDALKRAWQEDKNPAWREHVTQYIHRNLDLFHFHGVVNEVDYSFMRWTVDTHEDLAFVRHIYDHFGHDRFSWQEVLAVLENHPEWLEINRHVSQKDVP